MGPRTPDNSGAQFRAEIDKLFSPKEDEEKEEKAQDREEEGDKKQVDR
jgi:hypothetical protein